MHTKLGQGKKGRGRFRTICAVHNEMYDVIQGIDDAETRVELLRLLNEAYECGVRMQDKLAEYKGSQWKPEVFLRK